MAQRRYKKAEQYLDRIRFAVNDVEEVDANHETLRALLSAHLTTVPFENLAIVGHPHRNIDGNGVSLQLPDLFEKIVRQERGGYCFETNGLFVWLLRTLGYDTDRCAARVVTDDETLGRPPANHHTILVHLNQPFLVDVGSGVPQLREPVPLDGTVITDGVGIEWRVVPDSTPLSDFTLECRESDTWSIQYRFQTKSRKLSYFEATCEFLANEPDGTFTSTPIVMRSTESGHLSLDDDTMTQKSDSSVSVLVRPDEWDQILKSRFGISLSKRP